MKKLTIAKKASEFQTQSRKVLKSIYINQNSNLVGSKDGHVLDNTRSTIEGVKKLEALLDENQGNTEELILLMETNTPTLIHQPMDVFLKSQQTINKVLLEATNISDKKIVLSPINEYDDVGVFWAERIVCGRKVKLVGKVYRVTAVNLKSVTLAPELS